MRYVREINYITFEHLFLFNHLPLGTFLTYVVWVYALWNIHILCRVYIYFSNVMLLVWCCILTLAPYPFEHFNPSILDRIQWT